MQIVSICLQFFFLGPFEMFVHCTRSVYTYTILNSDLIYIYSNGIFFNGIFSNFLIYFLKNEHQQHNYRMEVCAAIDFTGEKNCIKRKLINIYALYRLFCINPKEKEKQIDVNAYAVAVSFY